MDFMEMKRNSANSLKVLAEKLENVSERKSYEDDRFWVPNVDKAGNSYVLLRFLPPVKNENVPFVRVWEHSFKGPTGLWYIEKSLTTIGRQDPVSEFNSVLWNSTTDDNSPARKQAREQRRRAVFISNIYILDDKVNPENNGKVKLFKYGKKIFDKIKEAMNPQFADEKPFNPFDFWEGANFKLKIRNVEGYRNYDKSEFDKIGPLFNDDSKLESIWNSQFPLNEFVDPSSFKSYDELKRKLYRVLNISSDAEVNVETNKGVESRNSRGSVSELASSTLDDDLDEDLKYFQKIIEED